MKLSKNFHDYEFVPPKIHKLYGNNSKWFINQRIVHLAQFTRDWFDASTTINNWYWGGNLKNRGYRTPYTKVGSTYSQHKLANAIDINVSGMTPDEVREEILKHPGKFMSAGLTTVEHPDYSPTWVHLDCRTTNLNHILVVKPATVRGMLTEDTIPEETYKYYKGEYVRINSY